MRPSVQEKERGGESRGGRQRRGKGGWEGRGEGGKTKSTDQVGPGNLQHTAPQALVNTA